MVVSTSAGSTARASTSTGRTGISTCRRSCRRRAASKSRPTCRCRRSRSRASIVHAEEQQRRLAGIRLPVSRSPRRSGGRRQHACRSIARSTSRSRRSAARYARVLPRRQRRVRPRGVDGAAQAGDWYGQPHRAASVAVEAGHRWTRAPYRPWLRAGYLWASGDRQRGRRSPRHVLPDAALVAEVRAVVGLRADEPQRRVRAAGR